MWATILKRAAILVVETFIANNRHLSHPSLFVKLVVVSYVASSAVHCNMHGLPGRKFLGKNKKSCGGRKVAAAAPKMQEQSQECQLNSILSLSLPPYSTLLWIKDFFFVPVSL